MSHVLGAGTELKYRQNLGERIDGQPQKDAPAWCSAAGYAARLTGRAEGKDGRRSAHARFVHGPLRERASW
jgi:hypothetical protein